MKQVLRRKKRATLEGGEGSHIDGRTRPDTALARANLDPVVLLGDDGGRVTADEQEVRWCSALEHLRDLRTQRHRGRPAAPVMDFFVGGLPPFADREAWHQWIPDAQELSRADLNRRQGDVAEAYFGDVVRWLRRCAGPGSRIATAAVHHDEAAPHLHAMMVTADERGRLGWNKVAPGFVDAGAPPISDRRFLSAVQSKFHADIAGPFGLERGATDSSGEGAPIDRVMGAAARLQEEQQEADRARADLAEREAAMVRERGEQVALAEKVAKLTAERRAWDAELAEWRAAASGKHDHPEPLTDYSIPLSPEKLSQLVVDGRQHGWPDQLRTELTNERTHRVAQVAGLTAERAEWRAAASGEHDHPEPLVDYSVPLSPGQFSRLVADGRQHGWPGVLQKELDVSTAALRASRKELAEGRTELTNERTHRVAQVAGLTAERAEWRAAASGEHDHPEPLVDYSVPLSPGQLSRLVADGRQHGWPGVLHKQLDVSKAALRASRKELDEGRTETVPPHKALRERANEMEAEIQDLRIEIQDLRIENRALQTSLDRAALRSELAPPQQADGRVANLEQQLAAEREGRETDATSTATRIRELEAEALDGKIAAMNLKTERAGRAEDRQEAAQALATERGEREAAQGELRTANDEAKKTKASLTKLKNQATADNDEITALRDQVTAAGDEIEKLKTENARVWAANLAAAPEVPTRPGSVPVEPSGRGQKRPNPELP